MARDPSRFSRLSQDERPVIRERPDPTLGFISTAEMLASPSEAAMGEREAVAWEHFCDESYFDMWCVRPTGERAFGVGFHVSSEAEAIALVETLAGKASPRPEAVGELGEPVRAFKDTFSAGKAIAAAIRTGEESKG